MSICRPACVGDNRADMRFMDLGLKVDGTAACSICTPKSWRTPTTNPTATRYWSLFHVCTCFMTLAFEIGFNRILEGGTGIVPRVGEKCLTILPPIVFGMPKRSKIAFRSFCCPASVPSASFGSWRRIAIK